MDKFFVRMPCIGAWWRGVIGLGTELFELGGRMEI
jgi:hypothetical protein